jgi:hypothetical protein
MRPLPLAIGISSALVLGWLLTGSLRDAADRPAITIERGALPVPPPLAAEASPSPGATAEPDPPPVLIPASPAPAPASVRGFSPPGAGRTGWLIEGDGIPYLPPVIPPKPETRPSPPVAAPATPPPTAPQPEAPPVAPSPARPENRCAECGEPGERSVTRQGHAIWFCAAHFYPAGRPLSDSTPPHEEPSAADAHSPAPPASLPTPAASAKSAAATQCTGMTRSGARCRRRTADSSGMCHQHRPKK